MTHICIGKQKDYPCEQCEILRLTARIALLDKVVEAAIEGPCRHTSDYKGTDCPLCAALREVEE